MLGKLFKRWVSESIEFCALTKYAGGMTTGQAIGVVMWMTTQVALALMLLACFAGIAYVVWEVIGIWTVIIPTVIIAVGALAVYAVKAYDRLEN